MLGDECIEHVCWPSGLRVCDTFEIVSTCFCCSQGEEQVVGVDETYLPYLEVEALIRRGTCKLLLYCKESWQDSHARFPRVLVEYL